MTGEEVRHLAHGSADLFQSSQSLVREIPHQEGTVTPSMSQYLCYSDETTLFFPPPDGDAD